MIQSVRYVVQVQCLHDNTSLSCLVHEKGATAMTIKEYTRKNILESLRISTHIANGYHIGATREELLLRLEANSNLQCASTILVDPEDVTILVERLVSSVSNNDWHRLYRWYNDNNRKTVQTISVPFPDDIADYWLIDRNENDIEANCITMVFDKMYNESVPFQLLTLYPKKN